MPTPEFVLDLRRLVGHAPLWLSAATAVVLRDADAGTEVLLVRRSDNGRWTPTAGIIDPGEEPAATAVREVQEETGVSCVVERLTWVYAGEPVLHVNGDQAQYLELVYRCRWTGGEPYAADDESSEAGWFPIESMPEMTPQHRARVLSALAPDAPWHGREEGLARAGRV